MAPGPVFYPRHLDLTKNECSRLLRQLELEAYAGIVSALRSQGDLTKEKKGLLTEICAALSITPERHRAEIRRAVNDEKLATIALHSLGFKGDAAWIKEGRRIVPLPARPQLVTAYVEKADQIAEITAKENASLPEPSTTGNMDLLKAPPLRIKSPTKPADFDDKLVVQPFSANLCAKCVEKQCKFADVETSTDDLVVSTKDGNLIGVSAPSASDSYVFLPGGTTVKVDGGSLVRDETSDAYSIKSSLTGNIDFGSAPEISLTGPRSSKRKRKKSVGSNNSKDFAVKIKKIIRPKERRNEPVVETIPTHPVAAVKEEGHVDIGVTELEPTQQGTVRHKPAYEQRPVYEPPQPSRPKKPVSHAITVQHTPVPPEHLYAVGSHKSKSPGLWPPPPKKPPSHRPQKRGQSQAGHGARYGNERTATFHATSPEWFTEPASYDRPRDYPILTTSPRRYSYSPSKAYRPPSIVQNTYGKVLSPASKRYRPTGRFSVEKKRLQGAETQLSASYPGPHRGVDRFDLPGDADGHPPHKILRPGYAAAPNEARLAATDQSLLASSTQDTRQHHTSGLDELASASILASELGTATMVKTGLAPVSAIVSRVSSPAPGPLSPMTGVKSSKSTPSAREGSARTGHAEVETVPTKHSSALTQEVRESVATTVAATGVANVKASGESVIQPRSVVVIDTKHSSIRQDTSTVTIAGQHPSTQVRLSIPEGSTPGGLISSVKQVSSGSHAQIPRVISTIAGKPHKVLKSSTGNVITVTAKSLPGMKTHPTIVSGASVVKPLGQKTSIIVVHKAAGSKLGKIASESIDTDGSKDITITRNLATPSVILPRPLSEGGTELCPPGSALGSIQGLVSGLTSQGDVLKKTKLTGVKPKFVTMPVQKKTIPARFEPARAKVISSGPGKVLVKTSTSVSSLGAAGKLRTFSGSRIVKQVASQTGSGSVSAGTQPPGQDIVAAALSQSLGASAVVPPRDREGLVGLSPGASSIKVKQEGLSSTGIIKVPTSTPAASTIKAFAATYQKNSSASQQKQLLSLSPVQKPVSSVTSIQPGQSEKTKIFLASPAAPKTHHMLFTPNQQLMHRSPQGSSMSRTKAAIQGGKPQVMGAATSQLATIGNLSRSLTKVTHKITQQGTQPQTMQVKVISQPPSSSTLRQPWQATSLLGAAKARSELDESAVQTKILQDILDSNQPSQNPKPLTPDVPPRSDRATFIYQYHPTTSFSETPHGSRSEGNDVIMLRSVTSDSSVVEAPRKPQKPVESGSEMVKVTLPATAHIPVQVQQDQIQENQEETGVQKADQKEEDSSLEQAQCE